MLRRLRRRHASSAWTALLEPCRLFSVDRRPDDIPKEKSLFSKGRTPKRVVLDAKLFRQPAAAAEPKPVFPYLYQDPDEDYYRRRFYPKLRESDDPDDAEHGLGGWRRRGGAQDYGRSFRENRLSRDAFVARYGVEALRPATKHRPFWETQDPGDLDDEKYFHEDEHIYVPIKPRHRSEIPKAMDKLVDSLCRFAREGNHFLTVDLLDEGADCAAFDASLWTPLHYAADRGRHQILKLFVMKDPDVNVRDYDGVTALMAAAQNGHLKAVQVLLEAKAELEHRDELNRTALLLALAGSHHTVASLLLDAGADVSVKDKDGWSVWHYAAFCGCIGISKVLIECPVSIDLQDREGNTPLHWSVSCGHQEFSAFLVEHGADRRLQNGQGQTAVHTAVEWLQSPCLSTLLRTKDDAALQNGRGETAKELATRLGHTFPAELLTSLEQSLEGAVDLAPVVQKSPVMSRDVVTLRVSGRSFVTAKSTLEVIPGSYFWSMLHPEETEPIIRAEDYPDLGRGPGTELKKIGEMEFELDRDPVVFGQILELLRGLKYSTLSEVELPQDKYEFGMLVDEAKFFRLTKIVESLRKHRRTRQAKSYRNVMKERQRKRNVAIGSSPPLVTDYGRPYQPPSMEEAKGNAEFRNWDPLEDPFARKVASAVKTN